MPQRQLNLGDIRTRTPPLSNQGLPPRIKIKQIQRLINHLLLPHHVLPARETLSDANELRAPTQTRVDHHQLQILQTALDLAQRVVPPLRIGIDRVQRRAHRLGDLPDLGEQRVPVRKDDEHVLPRLDARHGVDERMLNVGVVHVQVPAEDPPEHSLERLQTSPIDRACDESAIRSS